MQYLRALWLANACDLLEKDARMTSLRGVTHTLEKMPQKISKAAIIDTTIESSAVENWVCRSRGKSMNGGRLSLLFSKWNKGWIFRWCFKFESFCLFGFFYIYFAVKFLWKLYLEMNLEWSVFVSPIVALLLNKYFLLLFETNKFHFAVHLYVCISQKPSKCWCHLLSITDIHPPTLPQIFLCDQLRLPQHMWKKSKVLIFFLNSLSSAISGSTSLASLIKT